MPVGACCLATTLEGGSISALWGTVPVRASDPRENQQANDLNNMICRDVRYDVVGPESNGTDDHYIKNSALGSYSGVQRPHICMRDRTTAEYQDQTFRPRWRLRHELTKVCGQHCPKNVALLVTGRGEEVYALSFSRRTLLLVCPCWRA